MHQIKDLNVAKRRTSNSDEQGRTINTNHTDVEQEKKE
jgi:hypothetical protein